MRFSPIRGLSYLYQVFKGWRAARQAKRWYRDRAELEKIKELLDSKRHYFWGKAPPEQFDPDYEKTATCMYLEGHTVYIHAQMYDHEDNRLYTDSGSFSLAEYRQALQDLESTGKGTLLSEYSGTRISLEKAYDCVLLILEGQSNICSTPGGARRSSTPNIYVSMAKLKNFPPDDIA